MENESPKLYTPLKAPPPYGSGLKAGLVYFGSYEVLLALAGQILLYFNPNQATKQVHSGAESDAELLKS